MFIFIALPIFLVVVALSLWLASKSRKSITEELTLMEKSRMKAVGFWGAVALTFFFVWTVPKSRSDNWGHAFLLFLVVILVPLALGVILSTIKALDYSHNQKLSAAALGAFLASAPTPFIVPLAILGYTLGAEYVGLQLYCRHATVATLEKVEQARSVAFVSDSIAEPSTKDSLAYAKSQAVPLLNQSLVEYIERPATEVSGLKGKSKFERVSINGGRKLINEPREIATNYIYEPIDTITADFIVMPKALSVRSEYFEGLGGAQIEIYRRKDNLLISRAQYYWSDTLRDSCPSQTHDWRFVLSFISESLSARDPSGYIPKLTNE